ncbi:hypothetical protein Mucpa_3042 [Mucilaginibacter paludis DSM 18603]|uniref:Uncharacterized protein n=1 Tax=Mucilaginibacter paludis DSM 18603 TaxID=714943 RepID=H1YDC1_9SPHI|nr:hypothetical protein [Mucilaginibacter paludis]EHQ27147.1 hypothetical protein Mucpa_3042 [Mucilaginibacter paludis DSM 18603]
MYDSSLKYKWDNQNVLDYAVKAREEERVKLVKNLIAHIGLSTEQAASAAEVSVDLVKKIRSELNK